MSEKKVPIVSESVAGRLSFRLLIAQGYDSGWDVAEDIGVGSAEQGFWEAFAGRAVAWRNQNPSTPIVDAGQVLDIIGPLTVSFISGGAEAIANDPDVLRELQNSLPPATDAKRRVAELEIEARAAEDRLRILTRELNQALFPGVQVPSTGELLVQRAEVMRRNLDETQEQRDAWCLKASGREQLRRRLAGLVDIPTAHLDNVTDDRLAQLVEERMQQLSDEADLERNGNHETLGGIAEVLLGPGMVWSRHTVAERCRELVRRVAELDTFRNDLINLTGDRNPHAAVAKLMERVGDLRDRLTVLGGRLNGSDADLHLDAQGRIDKLENRLSELRETHGRFIDSVAGIVGTNVSEGAVLSEVSSLMHDRNGLKSLRQELRKVLRLAGGTHDEFIVSGARVLTEAFDGQARELADLKARSVGAGDHVESLRQDLSEARARLLNQQELLAESQRAVLELARRGGLGATVVGPKDRLIVRVPDGTMAELDIVQTTLSDGPERVVAISGAIGMMVLREGAVTTVRCHVDPPDCEDSYS